MKVGEVWVYGVLSGGFTFDVIKSVTSYSLSYREVFKSWNSDLREVETTILTFKKCRQKANNLTTLLFSGMLE